MIGLVRNEQIIKSTDDSLKVMIQQASNIVVYVSNPQSLLPNLITLTYEWIEAS